MSTPQPLFTPLSSQKTAHVEPWIRLKDNPLLVMQAKRQLRKRQLIMTIGVGVLIGLVTLFACVVAVREGQRFNQDQLDKHLHQIWIIGRQTLSWLLFLTLYWRGGTAIANAITEERESGIFTFLRATPLSSLTLAFGYLLGLPARGYLMSATIFPFWMICGLNEGVNLFILCIGYLYLLLGAFVLHSIILTFALSAKGRTLRWGTSVFILSVFIFSEPLESIGVHTLTHMTPFPALGSLELTYFSKAFTSHNVYFFSLPIPPTIYTLIIQGLTIMTCLLMSSRKIEAETHALISRRVGLILMILVTILIIGSDLNPTALHKGAILNSSLSQIPGAVVLLILGTLFSVVLLMISVPTRLNFIRAINREKRRLKSKRDKGDKGDKGEERTESTSLENPRLSWTLEGASLLPFTLLLILYIAGSIFTYFIAHTGSFGFQVGLQSATHPAILISTLSVGSCLIAFSGLTQLFKSNDHKINYHLALTISLLCLFFLPLVFEELFRAIGFTGGFMLAFSPLYSLVYSLFQLATVVTGDLIQNQTALNTFNHFNSTYLVISLMVGFISGGLGYYKAALIRTELIKSHEK